jgi:hypothetical protein
MTQIWFLILLLISEVNKVKVIEQLNFEGNEEHERKGISGSKGREFLSKMFLQSYWIVPLKTTSSVDLFLKEMSRKHSPSYLNSASSLTVYINSEVLESALFSFLYFPWNPNSNF